MSVQSQDLAAAQDYKMLQRVFARIDSKHDGKIDAEELESYLHSVGYQPVKTNQYGIGEVEHMMWEVDDDDDGAVSWEEFKQMIWRGRNDKTGYEPKKLFNVCQFVSLDRDGDGRVSTEECMEMIVHRYGRDKLDQIFQFEEGDNKTISLSEFLRQVHSTTMQQYVRKERMRMAIVPPNKR